MASNISYCSPADVEAELRADAAFGPGTTPSLVEVEQWIKDYSNVAEDLTGQTYDLRSVTEFYDYVKDEDCVTLVGSPVQNITSFEYNTEPKEETANYVALSTPEDYLLREKEGVVELHHKDNSFEEKSKAFRVSYSYGLDDVPSRVKLFVQKSVALSVLQSTLNSDVESGTAGGTTKIGSITIKKPSDYGAGNIRVLKEDIRMLRDELKNGFGVFRTGVYT